MLYELSSTTTRLVPWSMPNSHSPLERTTGSANASANSTSTPTRIASNSRFCILSRRVVRRNAGRRNRIAAKSMTICLRRGRRCSRIGTTTASPAARNSGVSRLTTMDHPALRRT